ncbi:MAG: IMPACT family protein [Bifidobacteriaceae bacterium]|nr:IMPACT family protein [Bifidobacteriaceae bacterium]
MALRYLAEPSLYEASILKSRFITRLFPLERPQGAKALVDQVRKANYGARHHATALVAGPDGAQQRSNDDGEPPGTAGAPMLEALRRAQVTDILAVVTRYFGGTLLGKAGLARAYGGGVAAALERAALVVKQPRAGFAVEVAAAQAGLAHHLLAEFAGRWGEGIGQVEYGEPATFELWLAPQAGPELAKLLAAGPLAAKARPLGQRLVTIAG